MPEPRGIERSIIGGARSVAINSASSSLTVHTPSAGRRFVVLYLALEVEADGSIQMKSGTTDISGPINFKAASGMVQMSADGNPLFVGRSAGEAFTIANPGTVQMNGTALIVEIEVVT